jgi:hypothetical protein
MESASMSGKAASLSLLFALAVALGGCPADKPPKLESNLFPTAYKQEIINTLKVEVFAKNDTTRVTNAYITDPALQTIGKEQHYVSCIRYTAHGTVAGLVADATRIAYYYGGHVNQLVEAGQGDCAKAAYKPFPELNAVCLGKGCQ